MMSSEPRDSGISSIGKVPWGSHFCHFYETRADLMSLMVLFFRAGLHSAETCLWLVPQHPGPEAFGRLLCEHMSEAEEALESGQIQIVSDEQFYLRGAEFDIAQVMQKWRTKTAEVLARGRQGMRIVADECWVQTELWTDFCTYEAELEQSLAGLPLLVMCAYPLLTSTASQVVDVVRNHQFAVCVRHGHTELLEAPQHKIAKAQIQDLNTVLEKRVQERTKLLTHANEELRRLTARLERIREEEGARIARELHDQLGSALTNLRWELEKLAQGDSLEVERKTHKMLELVDETVGNVRRIASELRPAILEDCGLAAALEWRTRQFEGQTGITCRCHIIDDEVPISRSQGATLFRILQEAFTNILRHARASVVTVTLRQEDGTVVLEIRDDGVGISQEALSGSTGTLGLVGIRERAQLAGGNAEISRIPGASGTVVFVRVPRGLD